MQLVEGKAASEKQHLAQLLGGRAVSQVEPPQVPQLVPRERKVELIKRGREKAGGERG